MPVINTNVASQIAQNANAKNARALQQTMQTLSTGKRVNSASDDAAGLAIATKLETQVQGLEQAYRNVNDAISLMQVAEGGVDAIVGMLQRTRELAVQAASETMSPSDRAALDLEFQALKLEINRTADETEFNGIKVLRGEIREVMHYAEATIDGAVTLTDTPTSGPYTLYVKGVPVNVQFDQFEPVSARLAKVKTAINAATNSHGVLATATNTALSLSDPSGELSAWFDSDVPGLSAASFGLQKSTATTAQSIAFSDTPVTVPTLVETDTYIEFRDYGKTSETLSISDDGAINNASDELSMVGGVLYRGNGTSADVVGRVDSALNGQNGSPLRIWRELGGYANGDFNQGTLGSNNISGWTTVNERVRLDGSSTIAGFATPVDETTAPRGGLESYSVSGASYTTKLYQDAAQDLSVQLHSYIGTTNNNPAGVGSVVHGPAIYSNNSTTLAAGDSVSFDWKAMGGADAYDVYAYLLNVDTGETETLLNATGANMNARTDWSTVTHTVSTPGNYKFVFVSGTWDATNGRVAGADLYIDNVRTSVDVQPDTALTAANVSTLNTRVSYQDTEPTTAYLTVNGVLFSSTQGDDATSVATDLAAQIQAKIDDGTLGDVALSLVNNTLNITTSSPGKSVDVQILSTTMVEATQSTQTDVNTADEDVLGLSAANAQSLGYKEITGTRYFTEATSPLTLSLQVGPDADQSLTHTLANLYSDGTLLDAVTGDAEEAVTTIHIQTALDAEAIISAVDQSITNASGVQATLGALVNRLHYAGDNLQSMSLNSAAAGSLIMDADYAAESTKLATLQIIHESSTAMLAQSNLSKQAVLNLLPKN